MILSLKRALASFTETRDRTTFSFPSSSSLDCIIIKRKRIERAEKEFPMSNKLKEKRNIQWYYILDGNYFLRYLST